VSNFFFNSIHLWELKNTYKILVINNKKKIQNVFVTITKKVFFHSVLKVKLNFNSVKEMGSQYQLCTKVHNLFLFVYPQIKHYHWNLTFCVPSIAGRVPQVENRWPNVISSWIGIGRSFENRSFKNLSGPPTGGVRG